MSAKPFPTIIQLAIEHHLPMWWGSNSHQMILHVQTGDTSTGKSISRKALTIPRERGLPEAFDLSLRLLESQAKLDVDYLIHWDMDFDVWAFGWDPEMTPIRDQLRQAAAQATREPTNWDGWQAHKRSQAAAKSGGRDETRLECY